MVLVMKVKQGIVFALALAIILLAVSCQKNSNKDDIIVDDEMFEDMNEDTLLEEGFIDSHTSQNSLDYWGIYAGILPCADCEGIELIIELNSDFSYTKKATYLGKGDGKPIETTGTYSWNEAGNTISLAGEDAPNQYFVGENVLFHLDMDGNRISGDLAEKYRLNKQ
jgi:uncharacterized lipoprotein NlpE involved in copper resistance